MPLLVVHGAKIACTGCPGATSQLHVTSPTGVTATQMCLSAASVTDHIPVVNVVPFASCVFLEGAPCVPATPTPWTGAILGPPFVSLAPVLTEAHRLTCTIGGLITIQDPGQHSVEVGDIVAPEPEEVEEEGFWSRLWDDGGLLLDVTAIAVDILDVPSGESILMIAARRKLRRSFTQQLIRQAKPKPGSKGGPGSGKRFSEKVKDQAERQARGRCVFCDKRTTREPGPTQRNTDHAIPRSRDGNNTLENAQNTCRTCNLRKGTKSTEEFLKP